MNKIMPGAHNITKILTDSDFDGLVCGAIAKIVYPDANILLGNATDLNQGKFDYFVDENTMICDLKYVNGAGLHFDHHIGNLEGLVDHEGKYYLADSAARIMFDFYKDAYELSNIAEIIEDVDKQDSGKFSLAEYNNPSSIIRFATVVDRNDHDFILKSIRILANSSFTELFDREFVQNKIKRVFKDRELLQKYILQNAEVWNGFVFIDLSGYKSANKVNSFIVSANFPATHGTIMLKGHQDLGEVKVRFYSNSFNADRMDIDYLKIAKSLSDNAGGHKGACGFLMGDNTSKDEIVKEIKGKLSRYT